MGLRNGNLWVSSRRPHPLQLPGSRRSRIAVLTEELLPLDLPYTEVSNVRVAADSFVFQGGAPDRPASIVRVRLDPMTIEVLKRSTEVTEQPHIRECISVPILTEFPSERGNAYAWYYAPLNPAFAAPAEELPPLIVKTHGGPTAAASSVLDLRIQYWTSRGYAVLDVDYGGSTGYGREYRNRLHHAWGIVDVEDCTNAAKFIVQNKKGGPGPGSDYWRQCRRVHHALCSCLWNLLQNRC